MDGWMRNIKFFNQSFAAKTVNVASLLAAPSVIGIRVQTIGLSRCNVNLDPVGHAPLRRTVAAVREGVFHAWFEAFRSGSV
jgi:hypothetical protein